MRELPECPRCQFYANNIYLVCALHPNGILAENNTCSDYSPARKSLLTNHKFRPEDLDLVEGLLVNQGYQDLEAHQNLAEVMAEMIYDPVEDLLAQPLSDFYYYLLRLSQLITSSTRVTPLELPDERYQQFSADGHSIMVHQAQFLIKHGEPEILTPTKRQSLYGHDQYIARRIAKYLSSEQELRTGSNQAYFDDLLERISANANLHGIDAVGRLRGSAYLFGYQYADDFDTYHWEQDWENTDKYPPVPFSAARTIAFVKERFNIVLDYPFL